MSGTKKNIRVAIRVRPFNRRELEQNQRNVVRVLDHSNILFDPDDDEDEFFYQGQKMNYRDITKRVRKKMNMEYDDVFDSSAGNEDIFTTCTKPLIDSLMGGYNCSVFVYGATGAGKTYTMLGSPDNPGITFLTMQELFDRFEELAEERKFEIGISYLEVYNEQVRNLLTKSDPLKLREDSNGVVVCGLVLKQIHTAQELLNLLAEGNRNRTQHPTDANAESSRSHAIFQVHVRMTDNKTGQKRTVKLSMIDLAGSERAASTKCEGMRFKEGANINKSLLALGNCINKLADGLRHIPYRDSNLTRILKDSLGGNCQTVMIANISPSSLTYEDTYNTLRYASRAKKIRTTLKQSTLQTNMPKEYLIKKVSEAQSENHLLKEKIRKLEAKLAEVESAPQRAKTPDAVERVPAATLDEWYARLDAVYETIRTAQDQYFSIQSKEKITTCKQKLKAYADGLRKTFMIDGLAEDVSRLEFSVDKLNKQLQIQREQMNRWARRYREAIRSLESIKQEITDNGLDLSLALYMKSKDVELANTLLTMKATHTQRINSIYTTEFEHWKLTMNLTFETLQKFYLLLRSNGQVDNSMKDSMDRLYKACAGKQKVVHFLDSKDPGSVACSPKEADLSGLIMSQVLDSPLTVEKSASKRAYAAGDDLEDVIGFAKTAKTETARPKASKSINFSQCSSTIAEAAAKKSSESVFKLPPAPPTAKVTISLNKTHTLDGIGEISGSETSLNSTFDVKSCELLPSVLNEQSVNFKNPKVLNKVVKQTAGKNNLLLQVRNSLALAKENRKTPNKIRKSPRPFKKAGTTSISATNLSSNRPRVRSAPLATSAEKNRLNVNKARK